MEIQISFQRKRFNKATEEFLCSRMDVESDSNLITNLKSLASGVVKKLNVNDANALLIRIIQAIIINDDLEETINTTITDTEHESEDEDSENEKTEDGNNKNIVKIPKDDPLLGTSKQHQTSPVVTTVPVPQQKSDGKKVPNSNCDQKEDQICKFFKNGRCNKNDDECRFEHPKICRKFNQFGPKEGNNKGCNEICGFFHPNACRNSIKDRACSYQECRFYHLKDTKTITKKETKS